MPRRPRFALTDFPLHIVQRGNDRQPCFFGEPDYRTYLQALGDASAHYGVRIHAYVLMTNHVHLLATPLVVGAVSRMMQSVGARYVGCVNATYRRTGPSGKAATTPAWSTETPMSPPRAGISTSIRCVREWSRIRSPGRGAATPPLRACGPTRSSFPILRSPSWAMRRDGGMPSGAAPVSMTRSLRRCEPRPRASSPSAPTRSSPASRR